MLKVLHIVNGTKLGGISSVLLNYYKHIDRTQIQFDLACITPDRGPMAEEFERLGAHIYFLPTRNAGLRVFSAKLRELINTQHYDAVHAHGCHSSWVDLRVAKQCGVKVRLAHGHNANKNYGTAKEQLKRRIGILMMRHYATARLACSRDAAVYTFGAHALKEKSFHLLPNAIETDRFVFDINAREAVRGELGIESNEFVLGTVGRMSLEKNQIHLVRIFPEILQRRPDSRLLLVGDGDCRPQIEAEACRLGVMDKVILTGGRRDIPQLLSAMDVFALPSFEEGFGIAALEAAAAGLPVILSDVIPQELSFIPNSSYLSLQAPLSEWAARALSYGQPFDRSNGVSVVCKAGYDIVLIAKCLEKIYQENKK